MNIRASLLAVFALVIGLAGVVVVGVKKDFPLFRDLLGGDSPQYTVTAARVDSRIEIDARVSSTTFELDLTRVVPHLSSGTSASILIELPPDAVVVEAGIRADGKEVSASPRPFNAVMDSQSVSDTTAMVDAWKRSFGGRFRSR